MKIELLHPTGNSNVRAVLRALAESGLLSSFNTTIALDPRAQWLKVLPVGIRQECLRRTFPVATEQIKTHPFLEIARLTLSRLNSDKGLHQKNVWASVDTVYQNLDKAVASRLSKNVLLKDIKAVYAYEDGALATFKQAKALGLKCIYDLPIAYWESVRKFMFEEAERLPSWSGTLGGGIQDSTEKLERKTQELELADVVVGPGQFVMNSLPSWAKEKHTITAPFGTSQMKQKLIDVSEKSLKHNRPLRVLFVGSMGQRKGLGDLFAAMKLMKSPNIELIVMGAPLAPMKFYRSELSDFVYESGRPNEQVLALMRSCDVFCLPSIVEGRALVMQEAMSQGLPLIITPNTGGSDLIIEGCTGFLIPIRSPESIAEKLTWFMDNRHLVSRMGRMAQQHAEKYTWEAYGQKIVESIKDYL